MRIYLRLADAGTHGPRNQIVLLSLSANMHHTADVSTVLIFLSQTTAKCYTVSRFSYILLTALRHVFHKNYCQIVAYQNTLKICKYLAKALTALREEPQLIDGAVMQCYYLIYDVL